MMAHKWSKLQGWNLTFDNENPSENEEERVIKSNEEKSHTDRG